MAIRERPTGRGDSTPESGATVTSCTAVRICTCKESVVSGGKSITPPFLGTERTRRAPVALVMAILVGRDAWEDGVREIEPMVRGRPQRNWRDGVVSPSSAIQGRVELLTRFSARKRGRSPNHELAVTVRLVAGGRAKNSRICSRVGLGAGTAQPVTDAVMALGMVNWRAMAGSSVWESRARGWRWRSAGQGDHRRVTRGTGE